MKLKQPLNFLFNSVFSKLLIILIVTGILINISVLLFFKFGFSDKYRKPFRKNIYEHIHYLVEDIGQPADPEMAKYVSLKTGFDVFYKRKNVTWQTGTDSLTFEQLRSKIDEKNIRNYRFKKHFMTEDDERSKVEKRKQHLIDYLKSRISEATDDNKKDNLNKKLSQLKQRPVIKLGFYNRRLMVLYESDNGNFIFYKSKTFYGNTTLAFMTLVTGLTLILLTAWYLIRKILKPIKELSGGIEQVSRGDLSFRVSQNGKDELAKLSGGFNKMTEQIQKMLHVKEELLIDISHELRSPITRSKVAMEFLPESDAKKSIYDDLLEIEIMINELLENARLNTDYGRPVKEQIRIKNMLQTIVESDPRYLKKTRIVNIPDTISLMIDPEQIRTVIRNILENAIKYSKNDNSDVEITYRYAKEFDIIEIKDSGRGIPEAELPYIFEPFYRVDKSRSKKTGGYGLGLSLCKNIMEAHGGKIEALSINMDGTTIRLYFN